MSTFLRPDRCMPDARFEASLVPPAAVLPAAVLRAAVLPAARREPRSVVLLAVAREPRRPSRPAQWGQRAEVSAPRPPLFLPVRRSRALVCLNRNSFAVLYLGCQRLGSRGQLPAVQIRHSTQVVRRHLTRSCPGPDLRPSSWRLSRQASRMNSRCTPHTHTRRRSAAARHAVVVARCARSDQVSPCASRTR